MNTTHPTVPVTEPGKTIGEICRSQIREKILPFWLSISRPDGSIPPRVDSRGKADWDAPRGLVMTARLLWSFSRLNNLLKESPDTPSQEGGRLKSDLAPKHDQIRSIMFRAKETLVRDFWDGEYSGFFWSCSPGGMPQEVHKQMYGQAFALYGMSEYLKSEHDSRVEELCRQTYNLIRKEGRDPVYGGYWDACSRDWIPREDFSLSEADISCAKSMNTHLHILEAFSNYEDMIRRPNPGVSDPGSQKPETGTVCGALEDLIELHIKKIIHPESGHLQLYFTREWQSMEGPDSFGHDIEAFWLIREAMQFCYPAEKQHELTAGLEKLFSAALQGLRSFGGHDEDADESADEDTTDEFSFLINEAHRGKEDPSRIWWVQAEAATGLAEAFRVHRDVKYGEPLLGILTYINQFQTSPFGEWHWCLNENNQADTASDIAGMWKTPYHNLRAMLEIMHRI